MKDYTDLSISLENNIATLTIQRPPNNFFDYMLIQQIADALEELDEEINDFGIFMFGDM